LGKLNPAIDRFESKQLTGCGFPASQGLAPGRSDGVSPNTVHLSTKKRVLNRRWTRMDADEEGLL
jgi:hypothetical protein